ncbi:probable cytochrome P450 301a1, mitochondrial [Diabrotica virgifera virgifera]|uniref:Cytochrome P450 301a1, mitochondrial n=1 Tax=Diabrotica virgifera virgifera TaxID=50390 RepID=A0ABM5KQ34_DIAVI|nr:probable cytochrome P450 301a1, mitochondrial [Diabrotica virgifera virgifera]
MLIRNIRIINHRAPYLYKYHTSFISTAKCDKNSQEIFTAKTRPTDAKEKVPPKESTIIANPYLAHKPQKLSVSTDTISFDEIPGPISLRLISKFWSLIPIMGTELTVTVVQYLLSGGKFFRGILSWGGNAPFFKKFFDVYGPVVRLHGAFGSDVVLLSRPEHASAVFHTEGPYPIRSCLDSVEQYRLQCKNYKQAGPFLTHGPEWEKLRKSVEVPLQSIVSEQQASIDKTNTDFLHRIISIRNKQEEMPANFQTEIYKWTLECLCSVTLNRKLGFLIPYGIAPASDPGRLLDGIFGATTAIKKLEYGFHFWKFVETPSWKSLVKNCDMIDSVLSKYIEAAKESLKEKKLKDQSLEKPSFIEHLLLKENIIGEDVMTVLLDMFLIGANATVHTVAFFFYHLARNPRCQIKLNQEIKDDTGPVSVEKLKKMKYLQACLKETLRLEPPIPIISRVLSNDVVCHHYRIPKGTHILYGTHMNNMREEYFEDATKFKPERWFEDEKGGFGNEYQTFASMPFGYGPRNCLAKEMAENQVASLMLKVCQMFRIEYNYGDIKSSNELMAAPTKPLKFRLINRV